MRYMHEGKPKTYFTEKSTVRERRGTPPPVKGKKVINDGALGQHLSCWVLNIEVCQYLCMEEQLMDSHLPWDVWVCTWNMYALATIAVCSPSVVPRVLGASDGHTWLFHLWTRQVSSLSKLSRSYVASILAGSSPYYSGIRRINHTLSSVLVNLPPYFRGPLSINHPAKGRQLQIPSGLWEFQVSLSRESQRTIHPLTTAVILCARGLHPQTQGKGTFLYTLHCSSPMPARLFSWPVPNPPVFHSCFSGLPLALGPQ